jgi:hypothetical protein
LDRPISARDLGRSKSGVILFESCDLHFHDFLFLLGAFKSKPAQSERRVAGF